MTGIATGINKKLAIKKQSGLGVVAPSGPASSAKYTRRVTSTLDLSKEIHQSQEITESQQMRDSRHGAKKVEGTISGELPIGEYQTQFESVLRSGSTAGVNSTALTNITTASTNGTTGRATGTLTRATGSWITNGFKIGDVVRAVGFTGSATANNNHNFLIINLTATVMTILALDKVNIVAKASGDSITISAAGRKIIVPSSGHNKDYHTIEHFFGDIGRSEVFTDCVFTGANISLPPSGLATCEFPVMGLDMITDQSQYFTSPASSGTGRLTASVNGALMVNGELIAVVTGLTLTIAGGHTMPGGVVGDDVDPDIFPGSLAVSGQITALFKDETMRDLFINEEEVNLVSVLTGTNKPNSDFIAFAMSRVKFNGSTKNDGKEGLTLTVPFEALEQVDNGGPTKVNDQTTISIQDSKFVA